MSDLHARRLFAATAAAVGIGLVIQLFVAADNTNGHFTSTTDRVSNHGRLRYGPRGLASPQVARLTVLFPLAYFAFSMVRGAVIDWYPYTFVDVTTLGYAKVLLNAVWIAVLVFAIAAGATALDARLARGAREKISS